MIDQLLRTFCQIFPMSITTFGSLLDSRNGLPYWKLKNLMTCDFPLTMLYMVFSCFVNIVDPDKLTLEKPDDQDQQSFLHYG